MLEAFQAAQREYMRRIRAAQQQEKGERREQMRQCQEQADREAAEVRAQEEERRKELPPDPRDAPAKPQQLKAPLVRVCFALPLLAECGRAGALALVCGSVLIAQGEETRALPPTL